MKKLSLFIFSLLGFILLSSCSSISKIDKCFMYIQSNDKDINNGKDFISIIGYNFDNPDCSMDVEIPEEIKGIPVKYIRGEAFLNPYWENRLNDNKMVNIGAQFNNKCVHLQHSSQECKKLLNDLKSYSGLRLIQSVTIPESIEKIGTRAFQNNIIKEIKIGKNIKNIGRLAFDNNDLQSILIHADAEELEIEKFAFLYNNLENVELPYGTQYEDGSYSAFDDWTEISFK